MLFFKKNKPSRSIQQLADLHKVELDVREELRQKNDPFQTIMTAVKTLKPDDLFILHATLKPTPLLGLMKLKGYTNKVERISSDYWIVSFVHKSHGALLKQGEQNEDEAETDEDAVPARLPGEPAQTIQLDNRGLEPPQPMVRTLAALRKAAPGDTVIIHNDRVPAFLLEEIKGMGYPCQIDNQPDGSAIVTIEKV